MECLYWLKVSFDGKRNIMFRSDGTLRTISHSNVSQLLRVPMRDYSPIVGLGIPLAPATIYRWPVESLGEPLEGLL